ncbi:unnamed protein product [Owenia fusiformis]|uniref:Aminomethyltransferase n=1 Tax=Owenia fusiformis TaxID=6347 RepID=A0A8S4NPB2_OWEFU|nr:unnamed protein product [Owenia fusiformis]
MSLFLKNALSYGVNKYLKQLPVIAFTPQKRYASSGSNDLKKTVLYDLHVELGGKMVDFAGWLMPVQYKNMGIGPSTNHTRTQCSLFDVSHMLQTKIHGKDRVKFMESLTVADVAGLAENSGTLSVFTNDNGGIEDDLIINNIADHLYVVSNAGCSDKDLANMQAQESKFKSQGLDVSVEVLRYGLIALQGPAMQKLLQTGVNFNLTDLPFMTTTEASVFGIPGCRVSRCGYTGEDGVEISVPSEYTEDLARKLLQLDGCEGAGLGARDALRLEAGLCLYGNDIDESTTPVEAMLTWTIGKRRKEEGGFPGADVILAQLKDAKSVTRKRRGFISSGPPARGGTKIYDASGEKEIGVLTSGVPSPTLKQNVSMGYISSTAAKFGTDVKFGIRNKLYDAKVTKMPFVPTNYYIPKK